MVKCTKLKCFLSYLKSKLYKAPSYNFFSWHDKQFHLEMCLNMEVGRNLCVMLTFNVQKLLYLKTILKLSRATGNNQSKIPILFQSMETSVCQPIADTKVYFYHTHTKR